MHWNISPWCLGRPNSLLLKPHSWTLVRHASLNSAISRGIRRSLPARPPGRVAGPGDSRWTPQGEKRQPQRPAYGRNGEKTSTFPQSARGRGAHRSFPARTPGRVPDAGDSRGRPQREDRQHWRTAHDRNVEERPGSAISGGNRRSPFARTPGKVSGAINDDQEPRRDERQARPIHDDRKRETRWGHGGFDEDEFIRSGNFRALPREHRNHGQSKPKQAHYEEPVRSERRRKSPVKGQHHRATDAAPERVKENVKVPDSVPYTTPASEFIYGSSPVLSALRCSRRQLYKLYIYQPPSKVELSPNQIILRKLALSKNIEVKVVFAGWDRLLDKMSSGWPHQNCVLEVSPLPKRPMRNFQAFTDLTDDHFRFDLAPQSREEAEVNGTDDRVEIHRGQQSHNRRYPVALLVDGIVDPGNLGAILRSAYFLGIDAVVFAGRNNAPLSPVTIKASCGAAENMALLHVRNEVDFIKRSKENGWRFYAADAPGAGATYLDRLSPEGDPSSQGRLAEQSPCVLMMGSEATGLSAHIKSHADAIVSIPGARHSPELGVESDPARVDSLNVSVAAALLMHTFMQTPLAVSEHVKTQDKVW